MQRVKIFKATLFKRILVIVANQETEDLTQEDSIRSKIVSVLKSSPNLMSDVELEDFCEEDEEYFDHTLFIESGSFCCDTPTPWLEKFITDYDAEVFEDCPELLQKSVNTYTADLADFEDPC